MRKPLQFHEMGLDDRILEAIARLGWKEPTLIQEKAIPYMLEGKDLLARARTGSGKTGAFIIPAIQKVLESKRTAIEQSVQVLILAPSKELFSCRREVRYVDVSPQVPLEAQRPLLIDKPDIVVGTPTRVLAHITAENLNVRNSLKLLIIDEADLMFAFDHISDIEAVLKHLPQIYQSFVTSATMWDDVKKLKKLILNKPVILRLEEPPLPTTAQLTQYVIKMETMDKVVMINVLFRLNMIRGKTIIFVNNVDKGYKLRMYLEQFGISSCVLNSEMPVASRCHIVEQFNSSKYDIIIASDEQSLEDPKINKTKEKRGKRKKDKESGVARGIDFQFVSNIINFDFPRDVDSYIHRVGRTARGNNQGTALSLVSVHEMEVFNSVEAKLKTMMLDSDAVFKDFKFDMSQLDGFRYRALDAWKRCTSIAIRETRKKELQQEMLNSNKLKSYFEDNPKDMEVLRHDKPKGGITPMNHLKHVPEYNVPENLKRVQKKVSKKKLNKNAPKIKLSQRKQLTKTQEKYRMHLVRPIGIWTQLGCGTFHRSTLDLL
ncbi:hypothetical protein O3P69_007440 [Scylla paramamosain]|uniref:RNA helicase n=1 Tax=Scylla paramamosain TaxID=85552 RepID=A0AAW0V3U8_SCYPA